MDDVDTLTLKTSVSLVLNLVLFVGLLAVKQRFGEVKVSVQSVVLWPEILTMVGLVIIKPEGKGIFND